MEYIDGEDIDEIKKLLLYRKIVDVQLHNDDMTGTMVLDDGTTLKIVSNEGCGGCSNGWYYLEELNKCDNAITNVELVYDVRGYDEVIQIFVYAEDTRIKIIDVYGDEGNGYYGRGFVIYVER
ncbi:MAG: hypothetical protein VZS44_10120 [Bacilli bacterium]|nr:hypothetical protein [Bacilli bacterium]